MTSQEFHKKYNFYSGLPEGWNESLSDMLDDIFYLENKLNFKFIYRSGKEKFAMASIFYDLENADDDIDSIIFKLVRSFEDRTRQICEVTGDIAETFLIDGHWYKTLSEEGLKIYKKTHPFTKAEIFIRKRKIYKLSV